MSCSESESGSEVDISYYAQESRNGKPVKSISSTQKVKNGKLIYSSTKEIEFDSEPTIPMAYLRENVRRLIQNRTNFRLSKRPTCKNYSFVDSSSETSPEEKQECSKFKKYRKFKNINSQTWPEHKRQNRNSPLKNQSDLLDIRRCKSSVFGRNVSIHRTKRKVNKDSQSPHLERQNRQYSKNQNYNSSPESRPNLDSSRKLPDKTSPTRSSRITNVHKSKKFFKNSSPFRFEIRERQLSMNRNFDSTIESPRNHHSATKPRPETTPSQNDVQQKSPDRQRNTKNVHFPKVQSNSQTSSKVQNLIKYHEEFNQKEVKGQNYKRFTKIGRNYNRPEIVKDQRYSSESEVEAENSKQQEKVRNKLNVDHSKDLANRDISLRRRSKDRHLNVPECHTEIECHKKFSFSHSNDPINHEITEQHKCKVRHWNNPAETECPNNILHSNIPVKRQISEIRHFDVQDLPLAKHLYNVHDFLDEFSDEVEDLECLSVRLARTKIEPPLYTKVDTSPLRCSADFDSEQGEFEHTSPNSSRTSVCRTFYTCCEDKRCKDDSDSTISMEINALGHPLGDNSRSPTRCDCQCHSNDLETEVQTTTSEEDDGTRQVTWVRHSRKRDSTRRGENK